jgi:stage V sporulation protein B
MSKAADMAKVSVKGGFHLLWGLVVSAVISAVGTIFIARLLGPAEFGLYSVALTAPTLISIFRDWGVSLAMIRYSALYNSENKTGNVRSIFAGGIVFETVLGVLLSVVSFLISGPLAAIAFHRPQIAYLIQIVSFTILTDAFLSTAQAAFTGIEKMELNSIGLVVRSASKTIIIPTLVILGLGAFGAVIGYFVASLIAGLTGLLLLWSVYRGFAKPNGYRLELAANIRTMFKYGLPASFYVMIGTSISYFFNFLMPIFATDLLIGNFSAANGFQVLIGFFATPITTMLFPAFSKLDAVKDRETLKNVFQFSIKYASLFVVPAAFVVITLSQPAVSTLFGDTYANAPLFLSLLAVVYLYSTFGSLSIGNLINGQGQTKYMLKLMILQAAIAFPLSVIMISKFGLVGLIVTMLIDPVPSYLIALRWLKKHYDVTVDWASSAKILLSSAIAAAVTYLLLSQIAFSSWIRLVIGVIIFIVVLVPANLLTRTIDRSDILNLRGMLSELGPFRRLFNFLLNLLEKLMTVLQP